MVDQARMESAHERYDSGDTEPVELTGDLVCGLLVGPGGATERLRHQGQDYYFCSASCAEKFRSDPAAYLKLGGDEESSAFAILDAGGDNDEPYICPKHPEVDLPGPGACPKCGMDAEPRTFMFEDD